MSESGTARTRRFGVFELDPAARQLRKNGIRIKLQDQPFRVLQLLTERPGEIVTREELKEKLWSEDTFVEFDHSLNTAVQKIRNALGDSATNPRFVETVPRVGYRFVAPVERPTWGATPVDSKHSRRLVWAFGLSLLAVTALLAWRWTWSPNSQPASLGLQPRPLTAFPGAERSPSLSPDGSQVAFEWSGPEGDNIDIYVQVVGAAEPFRLTTDPAPDYFPSWSPDGRRIAFLRDLGDKYGLFVISPHGDGERRITVAEYGMPLRPRVNRLAWTSDSLRIAFRDRPQGSRNAIYSVAVESGDRAQLTSPVGLPFGDTYLGDRQPAFSPDGRHLAFVRTLDIRADTIVVKPAAGGTPRELPVDAENIAGLEWAPDSRELLFSEGGGVYRVSIEGGEPRPLRTLRSGVGGITVAQSSGRLAWSQFNSDRNIWKLTLDANRKPVGPPALVAATTRQERQPQISPDGSRIVFASDRSGSNEIWMCQADGSDPVRISSVGPTGSVGSQRWASDSRHIVFDAFSGDPSGQDVWIADTATGAPRNLTATPDRYEGRPNWSADGQWVYYRTPQPSLGIWKVPARGGDQVQVLSGEAVDFAESPDGKHLYFTKSNGDFWRVSTSGGTPQLIGNQGQQLQRLWSLIDDGVFWVNLRSPAGPQLEFWDLSTRQSEVVAQLSAHADTVRAVGSLSISADLRIVLYEQTDRSDDDLYYSDSF